MHRRRAALICGVLAAILTAAGCTTSGKHSQPSSSAPTATSTATATTTVTATSTAAPTAPSGPAGPTGGAVPTGFSPTSATFISDTQGWVLGNAPCTALPCTSIVRTIDAGATWKGIPAPRTPLKAVDPQLQSISRIRFADPLNGYAFNTGLWTTHNGGGTWTNQSTVAGIADAEVINLVASGSSVYALVSGTNAKYGASDDHFRLARASAATGQFTVIADLGVEQYATGFVAAGGVVYFTQKAVQSPGTISLVRVVGNQLNRVALPESDCGNVAASTASALLAVCGQGAASGSMGTRAVYGSSDSGQHWLPLTSPGQGAGYDSDGVADAGNGRAVVGTLSGEASQLLSTSDGARTWHVSLRLAAAQFVDLGFEDATHGVVVATTYGNVTSHLYRTVDSGANWRSIAFS